MVSVSVKYFGSAIHKRFEAIQAQLADLSAVVQEALAGVRVVRAYNQEPHEIARFSVANDEYVRRNRVPHPAAGHVLSEHDATFWVSARCSCCGWEAAR